MIPSPTFNQFNIGPLTIHMYGIIIALAIIICYTVALKISRTRQIKPDIIELYFLSVLPLGFLGARIYHVITNFTYYQSNILQIFAIWNGGLGIMGGIIVGIFTLYIVSKIKNIPFFDITDVAAVIVPLGHAIGRWGNYFNQELFGLPTNLSWGLHIEKNYRPSQFQNFQTFHPVFLYESILNLINFIILFTLFQKNMYRRGIISAIYMINYGLIRLCVESIKIDPDTSSNLGYFRIPQYVSILFILIGLFIIFRIHHKIQILKNINQNKIS